MNSNYYTLQAPAKSFFDSNTCLPVLNLVGTYQISGHEKVQVSVPAVCLFYFLGYLTIISLVILAVS